MTRPNGPRWVRRNSRLPFLSGSYDLTGFSNHCKIEQPIAKGPDAAAPAIACQLFAQSVYTLSFCGVKGSRQAVVGQFPVTALIQELGNRLTLSRSHCIFAFSA